MICQVCQREYACHTRKCVCCGVLVVQEHIPPAPPRQKRPQYLGDYVAAGLAAVGVKKWPGCGCDKRQAALNRLDQRIRKAAWSLATFLHPR